MLNLSGTGSVDLPNPEFGDTWEPNLNISLNRNKVNWPLIYKGDRPTYHDYKWSFRMVNETAKDAFVTFLAANAGSEITVTIDRLNIDCETGTIGVGADQTIVGYITNDAVSITTEKDGCSYSFEFDFVQTAGDTPIIPLYQVRS